MSIYAAVTFAPVQGFISKSRKLRDLYGGSFILSYLSRAIGDVAEKNDLAKKKGLKVVSPAIINITQGTPNQIIFEGKEAFSEDLIQPAFDEAWKVLTDTCRVYIEELVPEYDGEYHWKRCWDAWINHGWEFFFVCGKEGETITDVREKLNEVKRKRNWTGINWVGESSTLSGSDAVAWYGMAEVNPKKVAMGEIDAKIKDFYDQLSKKIGNSIIDKNEQLSIPELIKRLITLEEIDDKLYKKDQVVLKKDQLPNVEYPPSFKDLNRQKENLEDKIWTGWFQGDGDGIGDYLKSLVEKGKEEGEALHTFSKAMINWGAKLKNKLKEKHQDSRIIYAGGDDFLGVLYRHEKPYLTPLEGLQWLYDDFHKFWGTHEQKITVSVGFVWAAPDVPQRDVLAHSAEAEQSAKQNGKDRLAIRILFNNGTYLEWVCPWYCLKEGILESYTDRKGVSGFQNQPNWTHFYNDVAVLESRHAFQNTIDVALGLFEVYFGEEKRAWLANENNWWNGDNPKKTGILGEKSKYEKQGVLDQEKVNQAINNWVINLAKVGFQICQNF